MKNLILTTILLVIASLVIAQSPSFFNYQAVARDAQNQALKNQAITLKISLLEGSTTGTRVFEETHQVTSSNLGILNLQIGNGQNQSGFISNIDWKNKKFWLKVEMDASGGSNYSLMGTTQLVSVPYALHAETATHVDDADADAANELQSLSFNSSNNELTISNGNSVTIPTGGTDADADPLNEIQTISKNGNVVTLSKNGGTFTDSVDDEDADASNELQNLNLSGNILSISDGNQIDLDPISSPWEKIGNGIKYEGEIVTILNPTIADESVNIWPYTVTVNNKNGFQSFLRGNELIFQNNLIDPDFGAEYSYNGINFYKPGSPIINYTIFNKDSLYQYDPGNNILFPSTTKLFPGTLQLAYDDFKNVVLSGFGLNFRYKDNRDLDLDAEHGFLMYEYANPTDRFMRLALMPDSLVMYNNLKNKTVMLGTDTHPDSNGGLLRLFNGGGQRTFAEIGGYSEGGGDLRLYGKNQNLQFIAAAENCENGGCMAIFDTLGDNQIQLWVTRDTNDVVFGDDDLVSSRGHIYSSWDMFSPIVQSVTDNVVWAEMNNYGFTTEGSMSINTIRQIKDQPYNIFEPSVTIFSGYEKEGTANFFGTNGNLNVSLFGDGLESYPDVPNSNYGAVYVYDSNGIARAGIEVNPYSDAGEIWADVKNFRVDHPNDDTKNIVYASLEGPEAAAYTRGTTKLKNGKVFIKFPEHYRLIANSKTMTVNLTPLYSKTFGLAVVEKTNEGIWVEELMDGKGNFSFDWEVKCIRKGHEDFKVIRDKPQRRLTSKQQSRKRMTSSKKPSNVPEIGKRRNK